MKKRKNLHKLISVFAIALLTESLIANSFTPIPKHLQEIKPVQASEIEIPVEAPKEVQTNIPSEPKVSQNEKTVEVATQIIVRLESGVEAQSIAEAIGASVLKSGPLNFATLLLAPGMDPDYAVQQLKALTGVSSAERNQVKRIDALSVSDPLYPEEYNLDLADVPEAWEGGATGEGITIAIVDTGVDLNHPDLTGNLVPGYNAITGSSAPGVTQDDEGHGTHVAGIAAAALNGSGVVGVAYKSKIMPIKVMDSTGYGTDDIIADGIVWAVNHGANIINLSLGSTTTTAILATALQYAHNKGVLIFASAGNFDPATQGNPGINYPASDPNVIAVTATDSKDQIANFSATGPESDLAAPGVRVLSTIWTPSGSNYAYANGTSMAAPFSAGVGALLWSKHRDWTTDQVRQALENGAKDLGVPGRDSVYGYGRVQAYQSLALSNTMQTLSSPATVTSSGAILQSSDVTKSSLLIPAGAFTQNIPAQINSVSALGDLPSGVLDGGATFSIEFNGTPQKILTLTLNGQNPLNASGYLGYIYTWSGSRWILVGGGTASAQVKVGIYEPGIYRVGYAQVPLTNRLGGLNRIATAIEISKVAYPAGSDTIILARADDFPDALTGAPLAYKEHAPLLLTDPQALSTEVLNEISRLAPKKIILLGSTVAISDNVRNKLSASGYVVNRIYGPDRYATAAAIAEALGTKGKAIIANGDNFPDALAIASKAAQNGEPILLTPDSYLASPTDNTLRKLSVTESLVIGSEVRVSQSVFNTLPGARRIAGPDRYATAADVLKAFPPTGQQVYVATGEDFPDALSGGVLAAAQGTSVVLAPPTGLTQPLINTLQSWQGMKAIALGRSNVVPDNVLSQVQTMIH